MQFQKAGGSAPEEAYDREGVEVQETTGLSDVNVVKSYQPKKATRTYGFKLNTDGNWEYSVRHCYSNPAGYTFCQFGFVFYCPLLWPLGLLIFAIAGWISIVKYHLVFDKADYSKLIIVASHILEAESSNMKQMWEIMCVRKEQEDIVLSIEVTPHPLSVKGGNLNFHQGKEVVKLMKEKINA